LPIFERGLVRTSRHAGAYFVPIDHVPTSFPQLSILYKLFDTLIGHLPTGLSPLVKPGQYPIDAE